MKRLHISAGAASALGVFAVAAKVFSGIVIDCPNLGNSSWISALLGMLMVLPFSFFLNRTRKSSASLPSDAPVMRVIAVVLAITVAFDAAVTAVSIGASASYIAIGNMTTFYLLLPQFALCIWCLAFNGNAIGNAARVWGRLLGSVIIIIAIVVLPKYRPSWLTPVLGPGIPTLIVGALRSAGWYALLLPLFLIAEKDGTDVAAKLHPIRATLFCGLTVSALLLLLGMLSPTLVRGSEITRFSRMDMLISNGRLALGLQMPMIVLWFTSLLFLLLFDAWILAALIQKAFPRLKSMHCILIAVGVIIPLSFSGWTNRAGNLIEGILFFPLLTGVFIITVILRSKKGYKHA